MSMQHGMKPVYATDWQPDSKSADSRQQSARFWLVVNLATLLLIIAGFAYWTTRPAAPTGPPSANETHARAHAHKFANEVLPQFTPNPSSASASIWSIACSQSEPGLFHAFGKLNYQNAAGANFTAEWHQRIEFNESTKAYRTISCVLDGKQVL